MKRIGAGRSSAFAFLVPVIGVLSSVLLLHERLTAGIGMGGVLVLVGLWLVQRDSHTRAPAGAHAPLPHRS